MGLIRLGGITSSCPFHWKRARTAHVPSDARGRGARDETVRQNFPPPLEAEEEESVLPEAGDRAAERAAVLVLVMALTRRAGRVELEGVGVQLVVAPEVEGRAVEVLGAALQDRVDRAAAGAPVLRVVGVGHDLEFLHRVHVGRELPGATLGAGLLGDRRAVEGELVVVALHPVDHVGVGLVPAAGA
jgi:hypothetical protein